MDGWARMEHKARELGIERAFVRRRAGGSVPYTVLSAKRQYISQQWWQIWILQTCYALVLHTGCTGILQIHLALAQAGSRGADQQKQQQQQP